jgi:[acyl-carrier-protein] S-malonyltransferase
VANDNAPGQVVVAGEPEAVARAGEEAKARGAKRVVAIPVAGAFHTELMAPARERLAKALATVDLADPDVPVVANVDARAHLEGAEWPELLLAQLTSPVRWRESLASVVELGATTLVEVGPGGVLTGLARRAAPAVRAVSVASPEDLELLAEAAAGSDAWGAHRAAHGGERLAASTRLVVSPAAGVFEPAEGTAPVPGPAELDRASADPERGPWLQVGALVGRVGAVEVLSPFDGRLVGLLVHRGERVQPGQPVAWLQADEDPGPGAGAPGSSATAAAGRAEGVR